MFIDSISTIPKSRNFKSSLKFVLYLKNKEVNEINKVLDKVKLLPKKDQEIWKKNYGEIINNALDLFVDDSNLVLKKLSLDDEVLELSHKLVLSLQDAVKSAEDLLGSETQLNS
ncbi:MAG: hypothetical protein COZ34_04125 [Candidatus Pacebacteria bacterium CG_4_10_14_3_um_filter_34_15]|nr:hypothetical protein [Candidatus Paceibacterota bacterium]OIO45192.1 MAG: hypothetical protein AUJ41_00565 [Candidatus Pacebacteria bacterium CG1_02_43_31]PIQ81171.1 MAG: hypothetical protein COV78_01685 [Candidatus Pacebacteria bacterium CG11_big_fil_rev_8_21_14_0_20_34_55]PIX81272.1 MAG: hypothetical protein COZ34_04125 [Candidatus Pacebacteria bacterium CG_4_10_14_3_um_filter_34_15]PJC43602.1 MAG: hypothetical protein CO039_03205 [Candidatus Pacebacteria bacterium CG_4_9_14_0_2_um_filter_